MPSSRASARSRASERFGHFTEARRRPTHRAARAGGVGSVAACDIAVAADTATFSFTEVFLGPVPAVISATVLPRLLPRAAHPPQSGSRPDVAGWAPHVVTRPPLRVAIVCAPLTRYALRHLIYRDKRPHSLTPNY
jgi:hypothetical protein